MADLSKKTKKQLIKELEELRRDIYHLKCVKCGKITAIYCKEFKDIKIPGKITKRLAVTAKKVYPEGLCHKCKLAKLKQEIINLKSLVIRKLQEDGQRYKTLLENLPQKIFFKDRNSIYISCNENYARDLKIKPEEIIGKTDYDFYPVELAEKYRKDDKEIIKSGEIREIEEKYIENGKNTIVNTIKIPVKNKENNIIGILGIFWDITKRRKAEEELKESELKFKTVFNTARDGILLADIENKKFYMGNKTIYQMLGYGAEEIKKMRVTDIHSRKDLPYIMEQFEKQLRGELPLAENIPVKRKDNSIFYADINSSLIMLAGRRYLMGIFRDVTERKKAEEKMKEIMKIKSHFISMVSHELRTPLTVIKESVSIVLGGTTGDVNTEQKDFLHTTKRNIDRLARLINDVLDFQKLESGRAKFHMQQYDINDVIREIHKEMIPLARMKGLNFIIRLSSKSSQAKFDRDRIIQVLTNLIDNSIKFTNRGSIVVMAGRDNMNKAIHVSVKDSGQGIVKEDLPKLFHRFEQLSENRRRTGGTGLGLSISKEIIERHNGKIWIDSEFDKGTTVHFTLPINGEEELRWQRKY